MGWIREIGDAFERRSAPVKPPPSWWNLLAIWPLLFFFIWTLHQWSYDKNTASRERIAEATVTSHDPHNHDRYGYTFVIEGKTYSGWAYPGTKLDFHVSEILDVYYDPLNPAENGIESFQDKAIGELGFVPFIIFLSGFLVVGIYIQRRHARLLIDRK